jgi:hypothetical protein
MNRYILPAALAILLGLFIGQAIMINHLSADVAALGAKIEARQTLVYTYTEAPPATPAPMPAPSPTPPPDKPAEFIPDPTIPLPAELQRHTEEEAARIGVDAGILYRLMWRESGFDVDAYCIDSNGYESVGLCQINGIAYQFFEERGIDPTTPEGNITAAATLIADFLERGGNMMITVEPSRAHLLEPLLAMLGVRAEPLADQSAVTLSHATRRGAEAMPSLRRMLDGNRRVAMPSATALATSGDTGWNAVPLLSAGPAEQATALMLTRGNQRVIVAGDADWPSNAEMRMGREGIGAANFLFLTEAFSTLADGEFPVRIDRPAPRDDRFALPLGSIATAQWLFMLAAPAALLVLALAVMLRRRRN